MQSVFVPSWRTRQPSGDSALAVDQSAKAIPCKWSARVLMPRSLLQCDYTTICWRILQNHVHINPVLPPPNDAGCVQVCYWHMCSRSWQCVRLLGCYNLPYVHKLSLLNIGPSVLSRCSLGGANLASTKLLMLSLCEVSCVTAQATPYPRWGVLNLIQDGRGPSGCPLDRAGFAIPPFLPHYCLLPIAYPAKELPARVANTHVWCPLRSISSRSSRTFPEATRRSTRTARLWSRWSRVLRPA